MLSVGSFIWYMSLLMSFYIAYIVLYRLQRNNAVATTAINIVINIKAELLDKSKCTGFFLKNELQKTNDKNVIFVKYSSVLLDCSMNPLLKLRNVS